MAEVHKSHRVGWLRAAVLGANDGILEELEDYYTKNEAEKRKI